jgi:hypothetical protein
MVAAARLTALAIVLIVAGCASDETPLSPKALRMTYGGDQAMYERLLRVNGCEELQAIFEGRGRDFPLTGTRADLGIHQAALQQLRALRCTVPAS